MQICMLKNYRPAINYLLLKSGHFYVIYVLCKPGGT